MPAKNTPISQRPRYVTTQTMLQNITFSTSANQSAACYKNITGKGFSIGWIQLSNMWQQCLFTEIIPTYILETTWISVDYTRTMTRPNLAQKLHLKTWVIMKDSLHTKLMLHRYTHAKQAPYDAKNIWHLRFVFKMADSFEWLKSKMAGKRVMTQDN